MIIPLELGECIAMARDYNLLSPVDGIVEMSEHDGLPECLLFIQESDTELEKEQELAELKDLCLRNGRVPRWLTESTSLDDVFGWSLVIVEVLSRLRAHDELRSLVLESTEKKMLA